MRKDDPLMNLIEEAIIYATSLHQGKVRKVEKIPAILHPLEVAQILATMTDDSEVIAAGVLHDVVEDTAGTLEEIKKRFGERVALLVESETEPDFPQEDRKESWKKRKELSLQKLKNGADPGIKMLWLADKLANIRSVAREYSERGEKVWSYFNQKDPLMHLWYYRTVAELTELELNRTGAYKELIKHINFIWPHTFDSEKTKYKKYKEVSLEGCRKLGSGKKGDVYRYNDELILKVYNKNNTYADVEREISQSRKAFVLGIPTAISFGIVSVGERYGAMFELLDAETLTECIRRDVSQTEFYAGIMADLARQIHAVTAKAEEGFPDARERVKRHIENGIGRCDAALAERCKKLVEAMPDTDHLIHGDFHTNNVFLQNYEPILIDMDRISRGDPVIELGDMCLYYAESDGMDQDMPDPYLGVSFGVCRRFFDGFLESYLGTDDPERLCRVYDRAKFLGNIRLIHRMCKNEVPSDEEKERVKRLLDEVSLLAERVGRLGMS